MTTTQVVEEALRTYVPPPTEPVSPALVLKGRILVLASQGRRTVTLEEANAMLEAAPTERE